MIKGGKTIVIKENISLVEESQWSFWRCILLQIMPHYNYTKAHDSSLMNHEKSKKHQKRVPPAGQTAFKVVKTSSSKRDALKLAEF